MRAIHVIALSLLLAPATPASDSASNCISTKPNGVTPAGEKLDLLRHGTNALWTLLWPAGRVIFRPGGPGEMRPDGSLVMKFPWWRGVPGSLTIEGRRLDGIAAPLRATIGDGYGESGLQATKLIFASEGCWEVTGRVGDATVTFVTSVARQR